MKILRSEDGQTLVLTALCAAAMMGFMGLALDAGVLFRAKRNVQIAADAAATAAALDYYYNAGVQGNNAVSHAQSAGTAAAVANGMSSANVTINCAPTVGPETSGSCNGYFEALVHQPNPTIFMHTMSNIMRADNYGSISIGARAVAGTPVINNACIWIMNPTASDVFHMQGSSSTINAPACGIYVNSSSNQAMKTNGNPTFNGTSLDVVGGLTGHGTSPTPVTTGVAPESPSIPTNLTGPVPPGGCTQTTSLTSITTANMASVSGSSGNNVVCFTNTSTPVTLNDGVSLPGASSGVVYVFEDGVTIPTGATVNLGSATSTVVNGQTQFTNTLGATMDLYGGTLSQGSGQSYLSIYAPAGGSYNSIAIMQPYTNTTTPLQVQFGSNSEYLDGIIYAPKVEVYLQDHGGGVTASGVICDKLNDKASTLTVPGYSAANASTTPFRVVTLTE